MSSPFNKPTIQSRLSVRGDKWHRDPPDIIPLWLADPDYPLCPELKDEMRQVIEEEYTIYGTDHEARQAISEKLKRVNKLDIPKEQIMMTQGVTPIMWLAIQKACNPGDEVIVTDPMYHPFFTAVNVTNTRPIYWKLNIDEGYKFDLERLKACITPRTKLIFVCNPHNPSGRAMTKEELKGIAEVAVDNKLHIMVDELWMDIIYDGKKHYSLAALDDEAAAQTMTSWGFSKTWSVPGFQAGFMGCTNKIMFDELKSLATGVLRGTNNLTKAIAPLICSGKIDYWVNDMIKYLAEIRDLVKKRLTEMGDFTIPKLEATYLMFPRFNYGLTSVELNKVLMEDAKVSLNLGSKFGANGDGHMRILTATSKGIMNEALDRIEKVIPKLEKFSK
ncbi:MAG: aminotransferase class I/II-fold pyridoxal phosphate-dependent enzyme [Promethearchaeota archaeon]|jgi:bifunctional pyridoxal-dependent enzyme with beta-cystathionase and maltose regulon repressor activities